MKLVEPTPLHPGVRPLPERASRPAIKDDERSPGKADAVAGSDESAALATPPAADPVPVPSERGTPNEVATVDEASASDASAETGSSDEKSRNRHDKRRRRPRRSGKRRRKGGNSSGDAPNGGGDAGQSNS